MVTLGYLQSGPHPFIRPILMKHNEERRYCFITRHHRLGKRLAKAIQLEIFQMLLQITAVLVRPKDFVNNKEMDIEFSLLLINFVSLQVRSQPVQQHPFLDKTVSWW